MDTHRQEDEIQDVGTFLTLDLPWAGLSLFVVRAQKIYAFANSCKHRGAVILQEKHESIEQSSSVRTTHGHMTLTEPEVGPRNELDGLMKTTLHWHQLT